MADQETVVRIDLQATGNLGDALRQASEAARGLGDQLNQVNERLNSVREMAIRGAEVIGLGFVGLGVVGGIRELVKAASEEEEGMLRLNVVARNIIPTWDQLREKVEEQITVNQRLTAFADTEQREALIRLLPLVKDQETAMKALSVSMDLARARGLDLATAARLVGMAYEGHGAILRRFGIELGENVRGMEALDAITRQYGGTAEEFGRTAAGQWQRFRNAISDIEEALGQAMLPALEKVARAMADIAERVRDSEGLKQVVQDIASAFATAVEVMARVVDAFGRLPDVARQSVMGFGGLSASLLILLPLFERLKGVVTDVIGLFGRKAQAKAALEAANRSLAGAARDTTRALEAEGAAASAFLRVVAPVLGAAGLGVLAAGTGAGIARLVQAGHEGAPGPQGMAAVTSLGQAYMAARGMAPEAGGPDPAMVAAARMAELRNASVTMAEAASAVADGMKTMGQALEDAARDLASTTDWAHQLEDALHGVEQANLTWKRNIDLGQQALKTLDKEYREGRISAEEYADKKRILTWWIERSKGGLEDEARKQADLAVKMAETTRRMDEAIAKYGEVSDAMRTAQGLAGDYAAALEKVPHQVTTTISTPGLDPAIQHAKDLVSILDRMNGQEVTVHAKFEYEGALRDIAVFRQYLPMSPAQRGPLSKPLDWSHLIMPGIRQALEEGTRQIEDWASRGLRKTVSVGLQADQSDRVPSLLAALLSEMRALRQAVQVQGAI